MKGDILPVMAVATMTLSPIRGYPGRLSISGQKYLLIDSIPDRDQKFYPILENNCNISVKDFCYKRTLWHDRNNVPFTKFDAMFLLM